MVQPIKTPGIAQKAIPGGNSTHPLPSIVAVSVRTVAIMVMMLVLATIRMMMMAVPVIMRMAIRLVLSVVSFLITPTQHGLLKIFRAVGVVVIFTERPLIQQWIALVYTRGRTISILHRRRPGVVMEVVKQLGVSPTQCNTAIFRGKGTVVDIGGAPEIATGGTSPNCIIQEVPHRW